MASWDSLLTKSAWSDADFSDQESQRLFSSDRFAVDVVLASSDGSVQSSVAQDLASLERSLPEDERAVPESEAFFFLKQSDSWSRIHISLAAFQILLSRCHICYEFCSFVRTFGSRVRDTDTSFCGYARRIHGIEDGGDLDCASSSEFCFSLRYPERRAGDIEDPWVMRRLLVHQRYDFRSHASTWIFLQCPNPLRRCLVDVASQELQAPSTRNWRAYVNYLESVIEELDEKACFSRVGQTHPFDYPVNFADAQLLQQYLHIILKAQQAIDSSLDVIDGVSAHNNQIEELKLWRESPNVHLQIEHYNQQMRMHKRSVATLADYARGTNSLLLKLLGHRNDETTQKSGEIAHQDRETLQLIASSTRREAEETRALLEGSVKDAKHIKSLTFIAMLYLPANLVAAIFNSNILSFSSSNSNASAQSQHLAVSKGVWLFLVLSVVLTAVTIGAAVRWDNIRVWAFRPRTLPRNRP